MPTVLLPPPSWASPASMIAKEGVQIMRIPDRAIPWVPWVSGGSEIDCPRMTTGVSEGPLVNDAHSVRSVDLLALSNA